MEVTKQQLIADLTELGLPCGSVVVLHSSLKSMGHVKGGADTVIDALLDALGPEGTLVVPTFSYCFLGRGDSVPYNHVETPSETGLIAETVRLRPEAVRSFHPTHSVAAIGKLRDEITPGHLSCTPLGENSPLHRVALHGGWVLLVGCGQKSNSFVHVAEVLAGMAYPRVFCWYHCGWHPKALFQDDAGDPVLAGAERALDIYECPGDSKAFPRIEPRLRENGALREGKVGQADAQLARATDIASVVAGLLAEDPAGLLCAEGECPMCDVRHAAIGLPTPPPVPPAEEWVT